MKLAPRRHRPAARPPSTVSKSAFILILSADEHAGEALRDRLRGRHGHVCNLTTSLAEAADSIRRKTPDVVVADALVAGEQTGPALLALLEDLARDATLFIVGPAPDGLAERTRVELLSPDAGLDDWAEAVHRAATAAVTQRENRLLAESLAATEIPVFEGIVGASPGIRRVIDRVRKFAKNKATVLILGETGTGKDLVARAIHAQSARARRPFLALNCAGLNENLVESELFGHVRGAFTSAVADRRGHFEAAHGGTLFLDEIGEMPITMQAKLLRVLDTREVTPVGSTDVRRIDVRVIAATNRNLKDLIEEKKFREDLYFRLRLLVIELPPLRERRQDIPQLAHYFVNKANRTHGMSVPGITGDAIGYLVKYYWPGNVRELESTIEALVVEVEDRPIDADDLPELIRGSRAIVPASVTNLGGFSLADLERLAINQALLNTGGNREQAARILGIGTRTLYRKIKEYGLT